MRHPEFQYLDLMSRVLEEGDRRIDRTGVGTLSVFGAFARFNVGRGEFPILTTKKVHWKLAVKEMLWFLSGETNIRPLLQAGVRIWTDWPLARFRKETGEPISQEDFEERIVHDEAFARTWGDLGPVYGKQWRRWRGTDGVEHDQVQGLIETLRENPYSRRMLFHAWNVAEIQDMALPPCHMVYQFHVDTSGKLSLLLFQRSCDLLLGAPFNWVGAVALLLMVAQQARLEPGELIWVGGDVHLYLNHLEQAKLQLSREPRDMPTLTLHSRASSIDDYRIEDFELSGYAPHPSIKADVAV
ncbi:thymidylate synthase [Luteibacter aegosomatis]|uniref:thymidylate synthase n=1 Tax=Luteibacter aegosomatis TaxID=2911537 RepID=UPI001FFA47C3|nr:thymidylate synthase [Luteibacter aegosomatis]UPG87046.1 thymidylate synthase [Luteibacter aegosomatis]